ncbi:protein NDNF-like [Scleropages formosus]|uniref:Protein NDNF n=1 Tax=Scleropages formosus TaxID=113540 RepID=A0A8C9RJY2_SCLFO|nr:protein NDNF-like [Scleropages formosus]XP_018616742.2 protein NDNF-like [Scleropages formosus]
MAVLGWPLLLAALCSPVQLLRTTAMVLDNEVPLGQAAWLPEGRVTPVHLPEDCPRRFYFKLQKGTSRLSVTVIPCDVPIEWSLTATVLEDKLMKPHWTTKKSAPEIWWRHPGKAVKMHSNVGNAVDTYTGPAGAPDSVYIVKLQSREQDTRVSVYLQEGRGPLEVFPELPADSHVHVMGVGMSSVTLRWAPTPSILRLESGRTGYHYCVLVNRRHNYRGLCAALEAMRRERKMEKKNQQGAMSWPVLKGRQRKQRGSLPEDDGLPTFSVENTMRSPCVCRSKENVCTASELEPNKRYYFDVFVIDEPNGTSMAYAGTSARTHPEAKSLAGVSIRLREGEPREVVLRSSGPKSSRLLSFRPRGWPPRALLTLRGCGTQQVKLTVSSRGKVLAARTVAEDLAQVWLQGSPSYFVRLENTAPNESAVVEIQASSTYHRQAVPVLPATLKVRSFKKLRTCSSVTLAWHGTEERNLYCVYHRRLGDRQQTNRERCRTPESHSDTERAVCKYFQELNPQRTVTTATVSGLEPGTAYVFDVYMMRRFGIAVRYHRKTVHTRKDC